MGASKHGIYFLDINLWFIINLFIEFVLFVTHYGLVTFVNSSESENSNGKNEVFDYIWICMMNMCMAWPGMYCV